MSEIVVYRGSSGLNSKLDPVRAQFDPQSGITELTLAYNVDIDDSGRVSRRKGYSVTDQTGNDDYHSMFCDGGDCLFVSGTTMYKLNPDYSATTVTTVSRGVRVSYVQVHRTIYFGNGYQKGKVDAGVYSAWEGEDYVGPTTTKSFSDPPIGHILEVYNGRIYVAQSYQGYHNVWYSRPFAYSWFDLARDYYPFSHRITLLGAVDNGLYISDEERMYFLEGQTPEAVVLREVDEYPALEGTGVKVKNVDLRFQRLNGTCLMWTSPNGIMVGDSAGQVMNLTEDKLSYPSARYGSAIFRDGKYLVLLES